jgi:hypothetical protein
MLSTAIAAELQYKDVPKNDIPHNPRVLAFAAIREERGRTRERFGNGSPKQRFGAQLKTSFKPGTNARRDWRGPTPPSIKRTVSPTDMTRSSSERDSNGYPNEERPRLKAKTRNRSAADQMNWAGPTFKRSRSADERGQTMERLPVRNPAQFDNRDTRRKDPYQRFNQSTPKSIEYRPAKQQQPRREYPIQRNYSERARSPYQQRPPPFRENYQRNNYPYEYQQNRGTYQPYRQNNNRRQSWNNGPRYNTSNQGYSGPQQRLAHQPYRPYMYSTGNVQQEIHFNDYDSRGPPPPQHKRKAIEWRGPPSQSQRN